MVSSVIIGLSLMHRKIYCSFRVAVIIMCIRVVVTPHVLNTVCTLSSNRGKQSFVIVIRLDT